MGTRGFGTTLTGGTTGALGSIRDINGFGKSAGKVDFTSGSSSGRIAECVAGIIEGKPINITLLYVKATYNTALGKVGAANEVWTLAFPDGATYATSGYIADVGGAAPYQGEMTYTVTIQPSGDATFTPGA